MHPSSPADRNGVFKHMKHNAMRDGIWSTTRMWEFTKSYQEFWQLVS